MEYLPHVMRGRVIAVAISDNELQMIHDAITSHLDSESDELHPELVPDFEQLRRDVSHALGKTSEAQLHASGDIAQEIDSVIADPSIGRPRRRPR